MKKQHPSTMQRAALRSFIRGHAGSAAHLGGRKINDLTMTELSAIATALGGDAAINTMLTKAAEQDAAMSAAANQEAAEQEDEDALSAAFKADLDKRQDNGTEGKLAAIRDLIMNGGFTAADPALRKLIADADKPAEIIEVPTGAPGAVTVKHAKQTNIDQTWGKLFSVKGDMGKRTSRLWDGAHADTPAKDDLYVWPQPASAIALSQLARGKNVFFFGPPGTGKTAWAMQFAASTGRPFALISCDDQTDAPTLLGMTVPNAEGGTTWQDGVLVKAIQTPGCVICVDEPSIARAGALMVLQNVLQYRTLYIAETGRRVPVAKGVVFIACDNTNGTGGGARHGFTGTGRLNEAFLRRWGVFCLLTYLSPAKEAQVLVQRTGCTKELAVLLISAATTTRAKAELGEITNGICLRRLMSWAEVLTDGMEPRAAFDAAILNSAAEQDREAITQQCLLTYDKASVARALNPGAPVEPETTTTDAAKDFD